MSWSKFDDGVIVNGKNHVVIHSLFDHREGTEKVDGGASLVGVANELGVQLLVAGKGDASGLFVVVIEQFCVGIIEFLDAFVGHPVHTVYSEFGKANSAIAVNINSSEIHINECLKGARHICEGLALTMCLDSLLKFLSTDFTVLVEISQFSDLVPQVSHDLLVLLEGGIVPLALALDDGVANSQAFEVVLVQEAVVVNVVHIPDDELDAVVPRVSHCSQVCTD